MLTPIFAWLAVVNGWTFFRFWQDKQRAQQGEWRIPESNLLVLALLGGTPAAFAARHLLRHKSRKQPFSTYLHVIVALQAGALIGLGVAFG
jgi:uncharacterized membrane protein YsdA (DUF1294 family)